MTDLLTGLCTLFDSSKMVSAVLLNENCFEIFQSKAILHYTISIAIINN